MTSHPAQPASPLLAEHPTPLLLLDEVLVRRNIEAMAAITADIDVHLRPHVKAHKSPQIARMQVAAGATGVTVSTVAEAASMVTNGIDGILIANQIVDASAISRLAELSRQADVLVLVEGAANVHALADAARRLATTINLVIELDVGMGRCGVRTAEEAVTLATLASSLEGVRLRGIHGYEGHCSDEPDPDVRASSVKVAMDGLGELADVLRNRGLPCEFVSAGSTGTFREAGAHPAVSEVQPGSYVLMDDFHRPLVGDFAQSLTVVSTVISVHGDLAVLDAGRKALSMDLAPPSLPSGLTRAFIHEEHLGVRHPPGTLQPGDRVSITPGYAPATVNLYGHYTVLTQDGQIATWDVCARHGS